MQDQDLDSNGGFVGDDPRPNPLPATAPGQTDWVPDGHGSWMPPQSAWPAGMRWDPTMANYVPIAAADPVTPNPGGNGGNTGTNNDIFNAPLTRPFDGQFTAPAPVNLGGPAGIPYVPQTPVFTPPAYTPPPAFKFNAPTPEQAFNDPGYKFRTDQGNRGLQNWAAAKGTLNDSSTAKALVDYNQGAATQEYANVWNRDWQDQTATYDRNYATQYMDPYQIAFSGATAAFAPQLAAYQTQAAAGQHTTDTNYLNSWNEFLNKQNYFSNWQDRTFNKQFQVATA
jgi:hypothetical protein